MINKTHISVQKPCRRQLNAEVCGSESAIFLILSCYNHHLQQIILQKVQVLTVILSLNWCLSQCGALQPLSVFIATNSPWSIKLFTALPGCCPLCRTPLSNVHMCTHSFISKPKTTVNGPGVRLVHTWNHELISQRTAGMVSSHSSCQGLCRR